MIDNLSGLAVFAEVAKAGSFIGASERIGLTPSAISKAIGRFEKRLDTRLFHRTTRSVSLTEAGRELLRRSEAILLAVEEAESYVKKLSLDPRGILRIACSDAFAVHVIVPLLKSFRRRYPDIQVMLLQGDGPIDLMREKVDLAIRFEKPNLTSFVAKRLVADPWVVCASPVYLKANRHPQKPDDLNQHKCLAIHARGKTDNEWAFQIDGQSNQVVIDPVFAGIGLVVKQAALAGLGIARLAHFLVKEEIDKRRLVPLLGDYSLNSDRHIYVVYPHRSHLPLKVRVFIDALEKALTIDE